MCHDKVHLYRVNLSSRTPEFPLGIVPGIYYLLTCQEQIKTNGGTTIQHVPWLGSVSKHSTIHQVSFSHHRNPHQSCPNKYHDISSMMDFVRMAKSHWQTGGGSATKCPVIQNFIYWMYKFQLSYQYLPHRNLVPQLQSELRISQCNLLAKSASSISVGVGTQEGLTVALSLGWWMSTVVQDPYQTNEPHGRSLMPVYDVLQRSVFHFLCNELNLFRERESDFENQIPALSL